MIEWKEKAHELNDVAALQSLRSRVALRNCGLLKFFKMQKMKKEVLLLKYMIGLWNVAEHGFQIGNATSYHRVGKCVLPDRPLKERGPRCFIRIEGTSHACR